MFGFGSFVTSARPQFELNYFVFSESHSLSRTLNLVPKTLNLVPETLNSVPRTLNLVPESLNLVPQKWVQNGWKIQRWSDTDTKVVKQDLREKHHCFTSPFSRIAKVRLDKSPFLKYVRGTILRNILSGTLTHFLKWYRLTHRNPHVDTSSKIMVFLEVDHRFQSIALYFVCRRIYWGDPVQYLLDVFSDISVLKQ